MRPTPSARWTSSKTFWRLGLLGLVGLPALWLSGCGTPSGPTSAPGSMSGSLPPAVSAAPSATAGHSSQAPNAKDYRKDAAGHVYALQKDRVFKGRLPPMLYAVGVLDVNIDRQGQIRSLAWKRAPRHAPEVIAEIERMVRAAAPYPAPTRLGQVTWTDVWLWDKSGRFQLDTLTEGQD